MQIWKRVRARSNAEIRAWFLRPANVHHLADDAVVLALLRAGIRFTMVEFLTQVDVDDTQLARIFPLLTGHVWGQHDDRDPEWDLFRRTLFDLHGRGRGVAAAAVLRLRAVLDFHRAHAAVVLPHWTAESIAQLQQLEPSFVTALYRFEFGPDRDQLLHWLCKRGAESRDLIKVVASDSGTLRAQNVLGLVPFRCLPWSALTKLRRDDPDLIATLGQSDPWPFTTEQRDLS